MNLTKKIEVEKRFQKDAKQIVDMLFDAKIFKDSITRDNMNITEDFISEMMSMSFESHLKAQILLESITKTK